MPHHDVIVLGLGGMGSSAAAALARRKLSVLGLDANPPGHTRGSSHGQSRVTRQAYFEHPDYVPLLRRAYRLTAELEARRGETLFLPSGGLFMGPPEGEVVGGSLRAAREHGVPHELLDADEVHRRFPAVRPPEGHVAVWEPGAGVLRPEAMVAAQLAEARAAGAELRCGEAVGAIEVLGAGVVVQTPHGTYGADALVLCAGPWAPGLLPGLPPLRCTRQALVWVDTPAPELYDAARLPVWLHEHDGVAAYGLPSAEVLGAPRAPKVSLHHPGPPTHPDADDHPVSDAEIQAILDGAARALPALGRRVHSTARCFYTMSEDGHFWVDRLPDAPNVVVATGFSGHGFKFTPVMGEVCADLLFGEPHPAPFLGLGRGTT